MVAENFILLGNRCNSQYFSLNLRSSWADDAIGLEICVEPWLDGLYAIGKELSDITPVNGFARLAITEIVAKPELLPRNIDTELLGDHLSEELQDKNLTIPTLPAAFLNISYIDGDNSDIDYRQPITTAMSMPSSSSGLSMGQLVTIDKITKQFAVKSVHKCR